MSYEINIIAINQKIPIHIKCKNNILLHNEIEDIDVNRYAEMWSYFSNTRGVLYSVVRKIGDDLYSAIDLCDSDFETVFPESEFSAWVSEDAKEYLTPLIINNNFYEDIVDIIETIIDASPQKRILLQTRYQGGDNEVILGVIKISKFKDMLLKKQTFFNVCYIIEKD